jgi:hypothetical protein
VDLRRYRSLGGPCASVTPRYQATTLRPVRAPLLPRYAPRDRMRVRTAANGVRCVRHRRQRTRQLVGRACPPIGYLITAEAEAQMEAWASTLLCSYD